MLDVQSKGIPVEPLEAVTGQVDQCQVVHVAKGIRGQLHYVILVQVNLKMINIYVEMCYMRLHISSVVTSNLHETTFFDPLFLSAL